MTRKSPHPGSASAAAAAPASAARRIGNIARIMGGHARRASRKAPDMWLIYLEALLAMVLFIFIVWWTMFHGRPPQPPPSAPPTDDKAGRP